MRLSVITILTVASLCVWGPSVATAQQNPAWQLWNQSPSRCERCGQPGCNGISCFQSGSHPMHRPSRPFALQGHPQLRIGRGGFPDNEVDVDPSSMTQCNACGGAGCPLCKRTGPLRPGYVRAATLGWIPPPNCQGHNAGGYPAGAAAYPFPWEPQYPTETFGGYLNYGDTCNGPYWYDVLIEGVALTRSGQANVGLGSNGIRGLGPPDLVLSTDSAGSGYNLGYRITGRYQWDAVNNFEVTYLGGLDWDNSAVVTSNNFGLFSVFSDFGNDPLGGFPETDQASEMSAVSAGDLQSLELICRRSWVSPDYKVNGSWHVGARYVRFQDVVRFGIVVREHENPFDPGQVWPDAFTNYQVNVKNDLVGPQIGTGLVISLVPALAVGGEAKLGVYGNAADQSSVFTTTSVTDTFSDRSSKTDVSFLSEARAYMIWQFHPTAKLRAGYEVWFLEDIATAAANFNTVAPFDATRPRTVSLSNGDQTVFHGGHVGIELGW